MKRPKKQYHVFVGLDSQGDACIFVAEINQKGDTTGVYLKEKDMEKLVPVLQKHLDKGTKQE